MRDSGWRLDMGAQAPPGGGVRFRVWAPHASRVEVEVHNPDGLVYHALDPEGDGVYSALLPQLTAGVRYKYRLDGQQSFPDPYSRMQPEGVHGPSAVVSAEHCWHDGGWAGIGGEGLVTGTLARPDVRFQLEVKRGSLALGASSLRVVPGSSIDIAYVPPAAPQLVLRGFQATTSVSAIGPTGARERYQITINVSGPIDRMQIDLSSSPPGLTREQMLAALGHVEGLFATAEGTLQRELANVLTAVGASTLFAPVERVFVEQLGFEQFSLEYSAVTPLALYLSRRLFDGVYLSYYQRLTGQFVGPNNVAYQLELSYRFRNLYHVSFGVDDQQTSTIEVGYQSAFD